MTSSAARERPAGPQHRQDHGQGHEALGDRHRPGLCASRGRSGAHTGLRASGEDLRHGRPELHGDQVAPSGPSTAAASLPVRDQTNQFKNGTHIEVDGTIFKIVEFQHVKPGKGGAFVRSKLKRVGDGAVIDKTFKAGEKFRPVRTETKKMQYLYEPATASCSWTTRATSRSRSPRTSPARRCSGCRRTPTWTCCWWTSAHDVQVPSAVELAVTETDPGLKGDTASGGG